MHLQGISSAHESQLINAMGKVPQIKVAQDEALYVSTLTTGDGKKGILASIKSSVGGFFSTVWNRITLFLETVFYCCSYTSVFGKQSRIEELTSLKAASETVYDRFIELRDQFPADNQRAQLREAWAKEFDALPVELRDRLLKEDMKTTGRGKGLTDEQGGLAKYVKSSFATEDGRSKAAGFVRDLLLCYDIDPIKDTEVPQMFIYITESLVSEIEREKGE